MEGDFKHVDSCKMRADYEGWWLFSDWPEKVIETLNFNTYEEMLENTQNFFKTVRIVSIIM